MVGKCAGGYPDTRSALAKTIRASSRPRLNIQAKKAVLQPH
jgi:hypothetical protein